MSKFTCRFEKVSGTPSWAKLDTKPEDDEDEDDGKKIKDSNNQYIFQTISDLHVKCIRLISK